jgi:hypothetical protein
MVRKTSLNAGTLLALAAGAIGCPSADVDEPTSTLDACANDPICEGARDASVDDPTLEAAPETGPDADAATSDEFSDGGEAGPDEGVDEGGPEADANDAGDAADTPALDASDANDAPSCDDMMRDGAETDVDCGGDACPPCANGRVCARDEDCAEATCSALRRCVPASCRDGTKNGTETDIDCGGLACDACALGRICESAADCTTKACHAMRRVCVASACEDGQQDGAETDVDCGGGTCAGCEVNHPCSKNGDCVTDACDSSFCTLASGPPNWIPAANMPKLPGPLHAARMTYQGQPGNLVVTSSWTGLDNDSYAALDFSTGIWSKSMLPATPVGLQNMTADRSGRVYVMGGYLQNTWVFDGTWATSLAMQRVPRNDMALATGFDGLVYAIGGTVAANAVGTVEIYDPASDTWATSSKAMPTPRAGVEAIALGHRIYAMGGYSTMPQSHAVAAVEAYDIDEQTWSARRNLPQPLVGFGAVAGPDGRVYVVGGSTTGAGNVPTTVVLAYDPSGDRWTSVRPLAKPRTGLAAAIGPDGRLYALGDALGDASPVDIYGPVVGISPSHASPGSTVLVTGSNFATNATVKVYLGPAVSGTLLRVDRSTATGGLVPSITFVVPPVASGDTVVTVVDDRSRYPVRMAFTVD